jgi:hypothetical protein
MGIDLLASVLAGVVTLLAALVTQYFARQKCAEERKYSEAAEAISKALEHPKAAERAKALQPAAERIPSGLSPAQLTELLDGLALRISALPAPPTDECDAVEGLISGYHE